MGSNAFCGEVFTNVHPKVLEAILQVNDRPVEGKVGNDSETKGATEIMQRYFKDAIRVVYAMNGTAANILALKSMLPRWGSVLCEENTHIHTHECGALESMLGNKILAVKGNAGKLTPRDIEKYLFKIKNYKYLPSVIVITQPTELGVLYTNEEIRAMCDFAHANGMAVYIDGARITNALEALNTTLTEMIEKTDVDAFSFGGTKAGAMFGEMVVFRRKEHMTALDYLQKQALQHLDKSKFLGVQMKVLLETELWHETASHANAMARYLAKKLDEKGIVPCYPVDTNVVFCVLNENALGKINQKYNAKFWDPENGIVRFVTTFVTDAREIDDLVSFL